LQSNTVSLEKENFARVFKLVTPIKYAEKGVNKEAVYYALCASTRYATVYTTQLYYEGNLSDLAALSTQAEFNKKFSSGEFLEFSVLPGLKETDPAKLWINKMYAGGGNRGKALHEAAFRMAVTLGLEERIETQAAYSSHCAHYQCGLRAMHFDGSLDQATNTKIADLIAKSRETNQRVDSAFLHSVLMTVPADIQAQKIKDFNIIKPSLDSLIVYLPDPKLSDAKDDKPLRILLDDVKMAKDFFEKAKHGLVVKIDIKKKCRLQS
jgi:hypothetical protein